MSTQRVVICGAARSPIGAIGGGLSSLSARDLMVTVGKAALVSAHVDPQNVEYTTVGWGMQDVRNMNIAKVTCEFIGAPITSPGTTVQENCASGGAAIHDIARRIVCGEIELGVAGGVESMSNIPRLMFIGRTSSQTFGDVPLVDGLQGGLIDPNIGPNGTIMGLLTESLAEKYGVSREMQDDIAYNSHKNAVDAWEKGMFDYVTPIEVTHRKKTFTVSKDEGPKKLDREHFTQQKPHFKRDGTGTITTANASSVNDGAAALVLASEKRAKELGLPILAELKCWANIGVPKEYMGEGAFKVLPKLFSKSGLQMQDVDYFEMNEAFAAVVGGALKEFPELDINKVNQWGSGVALGHPVGCTGCRQVVDMTYQLQKRNARVGVTSRCVGGGIGSGEVIVRYE